MSRDDVFRDRLRALLARDAVRLDLDVVDAVEVAPGIIIVHAVSDPGEKPVRHRYDTHVDLTRWRFHEKLGTRVPGEPMIGTISGWGITPHVASFDEASRRAKRGLRPTSSDTFHAQPIPRPDVCP